MHKTKLYFVSSNVLMKQVSPLHFAFLLSVLTALTFEIHAV